MKKYLYEKPLEMPRGTHFGSDYWITYSKKINRRVQCYSMLEFANFLSLEMNPNIEYFCEQPVRIELVDMPGQSSVIDFWVLYKDDTSEYQEVKYTKDLESNENDRIRKQITLQKEWCKRNNQKYEIRTEKELLNPNVFNNLKQLHFWNSHSEQLSAPDLTFLRCLKSNNNKLTIQELNNLLNYSLRTLYETIATQMYLGYITLDLETRPLDKNTEVSLCKIANLVF